MKKNLIAWLLCAALLCVAVCGVCENAEDLEIAAAEELLEVIGEEEIAEETELMEPEEAEEEDGILLPMDGEEAEDEGLTFELPDEDVIVPELPETAEGGAVTEGGAAKKVSARAVSVDPEAGEDEEIIDVKDWNYNGNMGFYATQYRAYSDHILLGGWTLNGYDGVEFYTSKKSPCFASFDGSDTDEIVKMKPGTYSIYMRKYLRVNGKKAYSPWSAPLKITVSLGWSAGKTKITELKQTDEDEIFLNWTPVDDAERYEVIEIDGKNKTVVKNTSNTWATLYSVKWGKHKYAVRAVRDCPVCGEAFYGKQSAVKPHTQKQLWKTLTGLKVEQKYYDFHLTWSSGQQCEVYYKGPGDASFKKMYTSYTDCMISAGGIIPGKTYQFRIVPMHFNYEKGAYEYGSAKTVTLKAVQNWQIAPELFASYSKSGVTAAIQLKWYAEEASDYYAFYQVKGSKDVLIGEFNASDLYSGVYYNMTLPNAMIGEEYSFRVQGIRLNGGKREVGQKSNKATVTIILE